MRVRRSLIAVCLLVGTAGVPAEASRTRVHSEPADHLLRGDTDGVAVTEQGQLFLAPRLTRAVQNGTLGDSVHVWDMVANTSGAVFLATGPDGRVLRITPTGRHTTFYSVSEPMVTALALLPGGDLLVAAAPGGRIYRVDADGNGTLWCETEERYVWSLAVGTDGRIFAGTGEGGMVLEISDGGRSRVFFDSDDTHIVSLLALPGGGLLAGGAGRGLVYRIDPDGNALVLYDDTLQEVSALALERDGSVLATLVAPPMPEIRSPALRIRLPGGTAVGTGDSIGNLDDNSAPTLQGVIEGLPTQERRAPSSVRGRLVRIRTDGSSTTLWRSNDEVPFALSSGGGTVLFGTGEPARLYRVEPASDVALLATLPEAQITGLLIQGRSIALATSNPASLYRVGRETPDTGVFISRPFDAGGPARWGSIRWRSSRASGSQDTQGIQGGPDAGVELYTRTGNTSAPDDTWSAWSPALSNPARSAIVNPDGRFAQWRARFAGSHGDSVRVSDVTYHYEPYNRAPRLREFYLDAPHPAVSDSATLRWATYDPDDDPTEIIIQYRRIGDSDWSSITSAVDESGPAENSPGVDWRDDRVILDTRPLPEGDYDFRAVINDQAGNHPGDGHSVVSDDHLFITVDQTPPDIDVAAAPGGGLELVVSDTFSDIRSLEVRADGRVQFTVRAVDGVCDSRREVFRFELPADGIEAAWSVRAIDSAGNKVEAPLARP